MFGMSKEKCMNKFVVLVNGGLYEGGKVFDRKGVDELFVEWSEGKELIDDEGEVVSVDELIECGGMGERKMIVNEEMCEMGDDYVEVSVCRLDGY
jgi:hypothetical protein